MNKRHVLILVAYHMCRVLVTSVIDIRSF